MMTHEAVGNFAAHFGVMCLDTSGIQLAQLSMPCGTLDNLDPQRI